MDIAFILNKNGKMLATSTDQELVIKTKNISYD